MSGAHVRLVKDLAKGDQIIIKAPNSNNTPETMIVVTVVPGKQLVERGVLLVTLRKSDGSEMQHTYQNNSSVRIAS